MARRWRVKQGDWPRAIVGRVRDSAGYVDIHQATGTFLVHDQLMSLPPIISAELTIEDDGSEDLRGQWSYDWTSDDLSDLEGVYLVEVEIAWPDGQRLTFPTDGYNELIVEVDLG